MDSVTTAAGMADFVDKVFLTEKPAAAPVAEKIRLSSIMFDLDSAAIKPEFEPVLEEVAKILKDKSDKKVTVEGHTCSLGTADYNQGLSMRRATAVKDFLVNNGIDAERLSAAGFGEDQPIADNMYKDGRKRNRRVEFKVK